MVAPGMLQNARVQQWLAGVEPAWTLLDQSSFDALRLLSPAEPGSPIRLAVDLSAAEFERSAFARGTAALLRAAARPQGLRLTAAGNLSRAVVAEMIDHFAWGGFDREEAFRFHKVVNEPDFAPLHLARKMAELTRLLRKSKGHLQASPRGRALLEDTNLPSLQALLFHVLMWEIDLGYLGRGLHGSWPQSDVGLVLWSLSESASEWQSSERLTRLCTVPIIGVLEATWDSGSLVFQARILRLLIWFGLLEERQEPIEGERLLTRSLYRKTPLYDRFLSFNVTTEVDAAIRH